jgi:hypothetical protein
VLLNILPGFRELRAPLAAGYLWLLAGWLGLGDSISLPDQAQDFLDQFSGLGNAAALTFAAYIAGSFLTDLLRPVWNDMIHLRLSEQAAVHYRRKQLERRQWEHAQSSKHPPKTSDWGPDWEAESGRAEAQAHVAVDATTDVRRTEPISLRGLLTLAGFYLDHERAVGPHRELVKRTVSELDIARFRLISEQPELFNQVDRLRGEGEFRLAVAAPLAAVAMTLCFTEDAWWFVALLLPVAVFAWKGMDRLEESGDRVADALRAGKVTIPALEGEPDAADTLRNAPADPTGESARGPGARASPP